MKSSLVSYRPVSATQPGLQVGKRDFVYRFVLENAAHQRRDPLLVGLGSSCVPAV